MWEVLAKGGKVACVPRNVRRAESWAARRTGSVWLAGTPPNSCPAPAHVYSTDKTAVRDAQISLKSQNNPTEMLAVVK